MNRQHYMSAYNIVACLLISITALFVSCTNDSYVNVIPQESQMLISIQPTKANGMDNPVILRSLLNLTKADDTGLDLSQKVYFFEDGQGNFGVCAKIDDKDKLEKLLANDKLTLTKKRKCQFAALPSDWIIGFSDEAALLMGPVIPAARQEMMSLMSRYLSAEEDEGIKGTPMFDKLDSLDAPMAMVCQAKALPEKLVAPFTIGAPKDTDPADIIVAATMETGKGRLLMKGKTLSFKKKVDKSLAKAYKTYRPIKGEYVKSMSKNDVIGLFLNVDGNKFHRLITQNRGVSAMLAGINAAIDMDNILKSVDGDLAIITPVLSNDNLSMMMAARLANADWLADVGYWKQSVPEGGHIGDWGKDCFYYTGGGTTYYFGVTPDMQYMSGDSEQDALSSIKASKNPIPQDLQKMIIGNKLVMIVNFSALQGGKGDAAVSLLKPLFGNIQLIVYTLE